MQRKLRRERRTWGALNHPNILPLYGFADDDDMFQPFGAFVSPWLRRGDSTRFLAKNGHSLSIEDRMNLWKDVIAGVEYLHTHQPLLIHGDLKPRNILINDSGRAQICDFGLVRIFLSEGSSGMTTTTHYTGTERYLAYELVLAGDDASPTTASDVYALGCIGLEFIFSQAPYSSRRNKLGGMIYLDIRAGVPPAQRPPNLLPHLEDTWTTLERCWGREPHGRPDAIQLRVSLEVEIRRLQIHGVTPPLSNEGSQPLLPSLGIEGKENREDSASSTVSGTSKPELTLPLEPKFSFRCLSDPANSTPTSDTYAAPATTGFISSRGSFPWNQKKKADPTARVRTIAPSSGRGSQMPPPPTRLTTRSHQQRLQVRLQKYLLPSTFSVTRSPSGERRVKVSFFVGSVMIGESGWWVRENNAKEAAAMMALAWLNTYGYY